MLKPEMQPAADKLMGQNWKDALGPEQRALQHLLRAEATYFGLETKVSSPARACSIPAIAETSKSLPSRRAPIALAIPLSFITLILIGQPSGPKEADCSGAATTTTEHYALKIIRWALFVEHYSLNMATWRESPAATARRRRACEPPITPSTFMAASALRGTKIR